MRRQLRLLTFLVVVVGAVAGETIVAGQVYIRPEPAPLVTADNESWYLAGEPITFSGSLYFPAGPRVFFEPREMVRTGDYRGIPLYARTTIEPFSIVYVPLAGRLMQPYERRRSGELAGTVGSAAPSFPIDTAAEDVFAGIPQAAAPPTRVAPMMDPYDEPFAPPTTPVPASIPTTGAAEADRPWGPLATAQKPEGINAVFIEYRDRRWFSSGPAIELDAARFVRSGEYHGFPVYEERDGDGTTVYVTVARRTGDLVTPYSLKR